LSKTQNTESKKYRNPEWLSNQYIGKDRTQAEIANICGCSQGAISKWCAKFDLEKTNPAQFGLQTDGYEQWRCAAGDGPADTVTVHKLLATLQIDDLDELDGMEIHHQSGVPWDNRESNLEVLTPAEHRERHT